LLKDEADLAIADFGELVAGQPANVDAVEEKRARRRQVECADHVHERGFTRPRCAHDRNELTARDAERDIGHSVHGLAAKDIVFHKMARLE